MNNTLDEIQKLETRLVELDKKQALLDKMKERAIKMHQETVDCYIGIIELKIWEKRNRLNNDYHKESSCCKCHDTELVPILEAILNSIKLLNSRSDKL